MDGVNAIARAARPPHLARMYYEALAEAERVRGGTLYTPDDDALVERIYRELRVQAFRRDMEPAMKTAARAMALLAMQPLLILDGDGQVRIEPMAVPADLEATLKHHAADVAAHYELECADMK